MEMQLSGFSLQKTVKYELFLIQNHCEPETLFVKKLFFSTIKGFFLAFAYADSETQAKRRVTFLIAFTAKLKESLFVCPVKILSKEMLKNCVSSSHLAHIVLVKALNWRELFAKNCTMLLCTNSAEQKIVNRGLSLEFYIYSAII